MPTSLAPWTTGKFPAPPSSSSKTEKWRLRARVTAFATCKRSSLSPSRLFFPIASITKSFTVATLGTLASEGKLDWDKPVREYMPDFRLSDDVLTARVTPRDLVTHRTGLPRHDGTWYRSGLTREDMYSRLRYLEPNRDLRREFQYNNLMFMTAGYMAGRLSGGTWEARVPGRAVR